MNQKTLKPLKPCPFCGGEAMFLLAEKKYITIRDWF